MLNVAVVAQVDNTGYGTDKKPIGGHIIAHASTTRLVLKAKLKLVKPNVTKD